jgi:hypothetical protein
VNQGGGTCRIFLTETTEDGNTEPGAALRRLVIPSILGVIEVIIIPGVRLDG